MPSTEFCSGCGRGAREGDRYCRGCGMLLDEAMAGEPIAEAEAYAAAGQLAQAIATIQRAIGAGESADLQIALCTLYLRRGGQGDARRALDRALALDANSAVAHAYIAGLDMHAGRVAEAQQRLDHALSLAPDDLIVRIKRAEYWLRLGIFDNAKLELRRALQNGGGAEPCDGGDDVRVDREALARVVHSQDHDAAVAASDQKTAEAARYRGGPNRRSGGLTKWQQSCSSSPC